MKITSTKLAWVCVTLLILYPVSAMLVQSYIATGDYYGIMAALFAANAGTALVVGLAFGLPQFSHYTSRVLRLIVGTVGVFCALMSALYWMADEVDHIWLRTGIISPVLAILFVLMWFIDKVTKAETKHEGEEDT